MKRTNVLLSALILGAGSLMLTGFDNAATPEDIYANYLEASKTITQASAAMDMNITMDMALTSPDGQSESATMGILGDLNIAYRTEAPQDLSTVSMKLEGNMEVTVPDEQEAANLEIYIVPDGSGGLASYANMDSEWEYASISAEQVESQMKVVMDALNGGAFDLAQLPGTLTKSDSAVDVNGASCYELILAITYADLEPLVAQAMSAAGEEVDENTLSMVSMILSGLKVNLKFYIDADTYSLAKFRMDMDGSDLSAINSILAYSMAQTDDDGNMIMPEITLDLSNAYVEATYDYEAPVEITVPEEALAAQAADALEDGIDQPEDTLEELVDELA